MEDDTNFAEWAGALLEWNSELRMVRFQSLGAEMGPWGMEEGKTTGENAKVYGIYNYS